MLETKQDKRGGFFFNSNKVRVRIWIKEDIWVERKGMGIRGRENEAELGSVMLGLTTGLDRTDLA